MILREVNGVLFVPGKKTNTNLTFSFKKDYDEKFNGFNPLPSLLMEEIAGSNKSKSPYTKFQSTSIIADGRNPPVKLLDTYGKVSIHFHHC